MWVYERDQCVTLVTYISSLWPAVDGGKRFGTTLRVISTLAGTNFRIFGAKRRSSPPSLRRFLETWGVVICIALARCQFKPQNVSNGESYNDQVSGLLRTFGTLECALICGDMIDCFGKWYGSKTSSWRCRAVEAGETGIQIINSDQGSVDGTTRNLLHFRHILRGDCSSIRYQAQWVDTVMFVNQGDGDIFKSSFQRVFDRQMGLGTFTALVQRMQIFMPRTVQKIGVAVGA